MADLLTAIGTLATKLIPNSTGDKRRTYVARMADYSHRLLYAEVPQLAIGKTADEATVSDLSSDHRVALPQILAALGFDPAVTNDPVAVLAKASADDNRNLALLGYFGQPANPGTPGVDWSLFERYYKDDGQGNWAPINEAVATDGAWQTYSRGE